MAAATIGALRVNLSANTAAFSQGLKGAQGELQRFAKQAKVASAAIATAMAGIGVAISRSMLAMTAEADKMGKMAQQIGVPVEELSRLKHAADLSGVSFGQLTTAVARLSRNMQDVASGAGAAARRAFDELGISVTNADGSLRSSQQVMEEVADRFARMEDGARKTTLAQELFGRSGAALIPMLNQGQAGLAAMAAEADQLGIVISGTTAKAAAAFRDNLDRLGKVKDGIILKITEHLLPGLRNLSTAMVDAANNSETLKVASDAIIAVFRFVVDVAAQVATAVRQITIELQGLGEAASLIMRGKFADAFEAMRRAQQESLNAFRQGEAFRARLWQDTAAEVEAGSGRIAGALARTTHQLQETETAAGGASRALRGVGEAAAAAGAPLDLLQGKLGEIGSAGQQLGSTLESAFSSMFDSAIDGTFKLRDAVGNLLKELSRLALSTAFRSLLGGFGGGGLGIPGLTSGTSNWGGGWAVVGERGPELVHLPEHSQVIPNRDIGPGGVHVAYAPVYNVRGSGPEIDALRAEIARDRAEAPQRIVRAVRDAQSRRAL